MGLLDGGMAAVFHGIFSGVYLDAELYRPNTFTDDGQGGGSSAGGFAAAEAVKIQPEATNDAMRAAEGYVDTDKRYFMLAHGVAEPNNDCELVAEGARWSIYRWTRDPAACYFDLHCKRKS